MKIFFLGWRADYEQTMIAHLAESYKVKTLYTPKWIKLMEKKMDRWSFLKKRRFLLANYLLKKNDVQPSDILICNEGQFRHRLNLELLKYFPGYKVLLIRNVTSSSLIDEAKISFDKLYSFDPIQCQTLSLSYLNQFLPYGFNQALQLSKQDIYNKNRAAPLCFFLALDKGRTAIVERTAKALEQNGCQVNFRLIPDSTSLNTSRFYVETHLPYMESLRCSLSADILLDITQSGQTGITLRVLEAAYFNKRLITNNPEVKSLDIYRPQNIYVIEDNNFSGLAAFLKSTPVPISSELLYRHSPEAMIQKIIQDRETFK